MRGRKSKLTSHLYDEAEIKVCSDAPPQENIQEAYIFLGYSVLLDGNLSFACIYLVQWPRSNGRDTSPNQHCVTLPWG